MAGADALIVRNGPVAAPLEYQVPAAGEIEPLVVTATFDGSSAAGIFVPELQILSPNGDVIARCPVDADLAVGGSADVSWFPGGRLAAAAAAPLTQGTWQRVAEPLIQPTVAWEGNFTQEPDVHYESGTWKMWYSGGGSPQAAGYATCTGDPTIPSNWTKYAGNPVLGAGGSGVAGFVGGINVIKVAGTYHAFYYDGIGGGNLKRSTSADGITWAAPTTAIASGSIAGTHGWANSAVWYDGTNWWMYADVSLNAGGGPPWGSYLFKNTAITNDGGWVVQNGGNPLTSLTEPGYTQGYGLGPNIAEIDGVLTFQIGGPDLLWYHVQGGSNPNYITDITHARTTDPALASWSPSATFDLIHNGGPFEPTQVADPCVLQVSGKSYLFFSGANAATFAGVISLATYSGTLNQFLNGSQGGGTVAQVITSDGTISVNNPTGPTVQLAVVKTVDGGSA